MFLVSEPLSAGHRRERLGSVGKLSVCRVAPYSEREERNSDFANFTQLSNSLRSLANFCRSLLQETGTKPTSCPEPGILPVAGYWPAEGIITSLPDPIPATSFPFYTLLERENQAIILVFVRFRVAGRATLEIGDPRIVRSSITDLPPMICRVCDSLERPGLQGFLF